MAKRRKRTLAVPQGIQNIRNAQARLTKQIYKATGLDKFQKSIKRYQRIINPSYRAEHRRIWNYIRNAQKKGGTVDFDLTPITRLQEPFRAQKLRRVTASYIHSLTKYPARDAYNKERNRIKGYIYRQRKAGNEVNFTLPERPKVPTFADVEQLKQFSNDYLRERTYTPTEIPQPEQPRPELTLSELVKQWEDEGLTKEQIVQRILQSTQETPQTVTDVVTDIGNDVTPDENAEDEIEEDLDEDEENGFARFIEDEERDEKQYRRPPRATDVILHNTYEMLNNFESLLDGWEPDVRWSDDLAEVKADDRITLRSILNGNILAFGRDEVAQRLEENAAEIAGIIERVLYSSGSKYHDLGRDGVQQDFKRLREILLDRPLTVDESKDIERDYEDNYFYFSI